MLINKAYKFRMYPNTSQQELINKTIGCTRFIYNKMLESKLNNPSLSRFDLNKEIPKLYKEYLFLKEVDSTSLRCAVKDLAEGFHAYYARIGEQPRFKKNGKKNSYRTNFITSEYKGTTYENIKLDLAKRTIKLPKLKEVSIRGYRNLSNLPGRIINATIEKVANKYYVSLCVEEEIELIDNKEITAIGIDVGVHSLVVTSDGEEYGNPKYLTKYEKKIKGLSRSLARKQRGSKNYYKAKMKLQEVYRKLGNARKKKIEEIISKITKENDIIVTEKLKVDKMIKENTKHLRKEIINATFSKFLSNIEYKCRWLNKIFYQVDTYYPSSQICCACENRNKEMKDLTKRQYECSKCGNTIGRDLNASINILIEGLNKLNKERISKI